MKFKVLFMMFVLSTCLDVSAEPINAATRQTIGKMLNRIVAREVTGANLRIQSIKASRGRVQIYATIGLSYYPFREENTKAIYDSIRAILPREYRKARLELYTDKHRIEELIPLAYRKVLPKRKKDRPITFVNRSERPLVTRLSAIASPQKGLGGRHIALWQSHGRYFDQEENRWKWQRAQLWQTCEDLYTQSYVLPYLVPMLENAGACVLLPRERDVQRNEAIADNDIPEQYREEGSWTMGGIGFAQLQQIYRTGENPFHAGTTRRTESVIDSLESRAVWRADLPEAGEYAVYVSYEQTPNSVDDAHYTVYHAGGETRFSVNQTMGGGTWIHLGKFRFNAGEQEVVALSNLSRQAGRTVSADAVKIGGGFGNIIRSTSDSLRLRDTVYIEETSGYPRFCEGARYWLQWAGFDESVYAPKNNLDDYKEDYMSRAHWVNALMRGSERLPDSTGLHIPVDLALAFHSDAGVRDGDETIGTLGIFYTKDNYGRFVGGADRYRSRDLTDIVMTQIVGDIRRTFEPEWNRRGLWNRSYYEARVPCAPTMLLELLSHQNFADMRYGNDPRFKFTVSRAVYKGILRYISSQYGTPYVVQPLPVEAFSAVFVDENKVQLRWTPTIDTLETTATPTGYIVYTRKGDGGFDNGRYVKTSTCAVEQEAGEIYSYRITAVNDGGESFPSETLAVCRVPNERGRLLIVNGFDRISAPYSSRCDTLAGFYNRIDAGVPDRQDISFVGEQQVFALSMARCDVDTLALGACRNEYETDIIGGNTFDYPYLHGNAALQAGYSFCSTSAKAIERNEVSLAGYSAVDLILGKQRTTTTGRGTRGTEFRTFTPEMQQALRELADAGGNLFISGSYVLSDLEQSSEADKNDHEFAEQVLHATLDRNEPAVQGRVRIVATPTNEFSRGEYRYHVELGPDHYAVETSDALQPVGDEAIAVMRYADTGRTAGIASTGRGRTFVMGFPFETVQTARERERLMRDILNFLTNR